MASEQQIGDVGKLLARLATFRGRMVRLLVAVDGEGRPMLAAFEDAGRVEQLLEDQVGDDRVIHTQKPA